MKKQATPGEKKPRRARGKTTSTEPAAAEARLRHMTLLALENVGEGIYWLDADGRMLYVNPAAERELGYSAEELRQMRVSDIDPNVPPEYWGKDGALMRARETQYRGLHNFRTAHRHRDGHMIPVEINSGYFEYEGEIYAIAICSDITERLAAEEALRASEAKFSAIFSMTPDPMALTRLADGTMLDASASYAEFFGYRKEEMIGHTTLPEDLNLWFEAADRLRWRDQLEPNGEVLGFEAQMRRRDGGTVTVLISGKIIELEGQHCVIVVLRDITRRKQMEEMLRREKAEQAALIKKLEETQAQLLQSEKLAGIGQLAAGVAHEINNPMGFIRSNLGTLRDYTERLLDLVTAYENACPSGQMEAAEHLRQVRAAADLEFLSGDLRQLVAESIEGADRVRRIVQDLRDFSRVQPDDWERFDIHAGLESTINMVWNEIRDKADLIRDYGELPAIECIPSRLNQVFMNILVNAAQAITEHGRITIATRRQGDEVEIAFSDTGAGIPEDIRARLFDPFFTTKPVGKGTGLGLSVSYGIVKNHGGSITVDSTPGAGSTFTIRLPIVRRPPANEPNSTA